MEPAPSDFVSAVQIACNEATLTLPCLDCLVLEAASCGNLLQSAFPVHALTLLMCVFVTGGGNSTKATLKVTRQNQAEDAQNRVAMVSEHVGFKSNQEDRLRVAKARKDLFKYASDRKHKALLRQVHGTPMKSKYTIGQCLFRKK